MKSLANDNLDPGLVEIAMQGGIGTVGQGVIRLQHLLAALR